MFKLNKLQHKKIGILGLGRENQALLKFLFSHNLKAEFTLCDFREKSHLEEKLKELDLPSSEFKFKTQFDFNKNLEECDILFRSPGWSLKCPGIKQARQHNTEISSPMNLFFSLCPSKNIIGVTGTKGKGTTSSLIYKILENYYKDDDTQVFLGGNIGTAPFGFIEGIQPSDWIILELSSFQLEDLSYSPKWAIITNIYPEHLSPADPSNPNYHENFQEYLQAKANIFKFQNTSDYLIINKKTHHKFKSEISQHHQGNIVNYTKSEMQSNLNGNYNKENIGAAKALTYKVLNIDLKTIKQAVLDFQPLEHRLETVRVKDGITYYDNSFSTTPESSILDVKSFSSDIILLAGGADKGSDFSKFAQTIKDKVKLVILFQGEGSARLKEELERINFPGSQIKIVDNMKTAVQEANQQAKAEDIVLLSTGCASFGVFENYKQRGNLFKKYVQEL